MDGLDALAGLALTHQCAMLEKHGLLQSIFIGNVMLDGSPMPRRGYLNQNENDAELDCARFFSNGPVIFLMASHLDPLSPGGYARARQDALAVYRTLEKDRKASHIAVYGNSAGAVLSGELIAKLTSLHRPMPAALGFFSGSADLSKSGDSESWAPLPTGDKTLASAISSYVGNTSTSDPILSPIHGDLSRFLPTLLVSSTRDSLLSGTSIFGRALIEQGVDARLVVFDALPHAFWSYMDIPETGQANALIAHFLKTHVGGSTR
jgi:alpha/beta hydrolase fold